MWTRSTPRCLTLRFSGGAQHNAVRCSRWLGSLGVAAPVLRRELQSAKQWVLFWNRRAADGAMTDARPHLTHKVADEHDPSAAHLLACITATVDEQGDLINMLGNRNTGEQCWDVPSAGLELLLVPHFPLGSAIRVKRRFDVRE